MPAIDILLRLFLILATPLGNPSITSPRYNTVTVTIFRKSLPINLLSFAFYFKLKNRIRTEPKNKKTKNKNNHT